MESFRQIIQYLFNKYQEDGHYEHGKFYIEYDEEDSLFVISLDLAKVLTYRDLVAISIYRTKFLLGDDFKNFMELDGDTITIEKNTQNPEIMCLLYLLFSDSDRIDMMYDTDEDVFTLEYIQECQDYLIKYNILLTSLGNILESIKSKYEESPTKQFIRCYLGQDTVKSARNV